MISGIFHQGSGLGNQLHRYIATRVFAADRGWEFGMYNPQFFKGAFMRLDLGSSCAIDTPYYFTEKCIRDDYNTDIRSYDPEFNFIEDNTILDGEFQDERYFSHRLSEIKEWIKTEVVEMPDDLCIINFRGGEYTFVPDLFLPQEYWDKAIKLMRDKYPNIKFDVHTDDMVTARKFFPDFPVYKNIEANWCSIRYAKHLILSNSSFGILPALMNEEVKEIIAPRYWARYNTKIWATQQNYYKKFTYI